MPTVSNRSDLLDALKNARGGETITLKNGNYGSITVDDDYASTVTVRAQDRLGATINTLKVDGATNVKFDGINFYSGGNGGPGGRIVSIENGSRYIDVVNSEVWGKKDGTYVGHNGIYVSGSNNIDIINNNVHDVDNGIMLFGSSGSNVRSNKVDYYANDALKFSGVNNVSVEDNISYGHVFAPSGAHNDFMQFQGASSNVEISGNVFLPSNTASSQGIFLNNATYKDIDINNNIVSTGMLNGIYVSSGSGISVSNNTILDIPGLIGKSTLIIVPGGSSVNNNFMTSYAGGPSGSNIKLQSGDPRDDYYLNDFYKNAAKGLGLTFEDLMPVAGTAAETKGAAARIYELLGSSAPASTPSPAPSPEPAPAPAQSSGAFTVTLVDAGSDKFVERLSDGESATISTPAARRTIDVVHSEKPGSIYMELDRGNGAGVTTKLENVGPYSLTGDSSSGDYNLPDFDFRDGSYSLTLTAYSGANKSGGVLGTDTFDFTLKQADSTSSPAPAPAPAPSPEPTPEPAPAPAPSSGAFTVTLVDAGSDKFVERLSDGESATISTPAARRTIDVVHSEKPGSIYMELDRGNGASVTTKLENVGPYSLTGDSGGDYKLPTFDFGDGSYSLTLTAYGGANRSGAVLSTETFDFTVAEEGGTSAPAPAPSPEPATGTPTKVYGFDGAREFYGQSGNIQKIGHADKFEISEGSIHFRFDADTVSGSRGLTSKDATGYVGGGHHFAARLLDGELQLRFQDADSSVWLKKSGIQANKSYDVLATFEADEIRLYVDDTLAARADFTMDWSKNGQVMQVGGLGWTSASGANTSTDPFDGTLSKFAIWDQALTPGEADALL